MGLNNRRSYERCFISYFLVVARCCHIFSVSVVSIYIGGYMVNELKRVKEINAILETNPNMWHGAKAG